LPSIFRGSVPMGVVTLNHFFKRIDFGVPDFRPHGLRGTAATLLRERGFGRDVVEQLLARSEKNAAVAADSQSNRAGGRAEKGVAVLGGSGGRARRRCDRNAIARGLSGQSQSPLNGRRSRWLPAASRQPSRPRLTP
jgi:hypothetical protein